MEVAAAAGGGLVVEMSSFSLGEEGASSSSEDENERRGIRCGGECFVRGAQIFDISPLAGLMDAVKARVLASISSALGVSIRADTCVVTGRGVLQQAAVTQLGKWECLLVTAAWGFFFRLLFYFSLVLGSKNKRR